MAGASGGYGAISRDTANHARIRFERRIPAPIDRVWAVLTDPAELARWLAASSVDLRPGGLIEHDFHPGDAGSHVHGRILVLQPPTALEYEWRFVGEPDSIVRFDLQADGSDTVLTLTHRLLGIPRGAGYGAGWHAYLDALVAVASGRPTADWDARFAAVRGAYSTPSS